MSTSSSGVDSTELPRSMHESDVNHKYQQCLPMSFFNFQGCYEKIKDDLEDNLVVVIGVGIAFALIQVSDHLVLLKFRTGRGVGRLGSLCS